MKNKRFGFLVILAFAALASSCGTSAYYSASEYNDGIYYRPTKAERARMVATKEAQREQARNSRYEQYLAQDENGNLYVVTELLDGETYASRLHKFDSPWYNYSYLPWYANPYYYGYSSWGNPWYWDYPYYYSPYYYSYRPWLWGAGVYAGWYGWHHFGYYDYWAWRDRYYHYNPGPGPAPRNSTSRVYTTRNCCNGGGMYRTSGTNNGRGIYTTRRTDYCRSVSTRTGSSGSSAVRSSSSSSSRPTRTGASGGSGSYTRSSGSYSSGGGYSGGGYSGGGSGSSGGGRSVSGGSHSGGGRR